VSQRERDRGEDI
jgi:hypothetical protein